MRTHKPRHLLFWNKHHKDAGEDTPHLPLSFGVEFEFLLLSKGELVDPYAQVASLLQHFGCPAVSDGSHHTFRRKKEAASKFSSWRVLGDISVGSLEDDPVPEIVSRLIVQNPDAGSPTKAPEFLTKEEDKDYWFPAGVEVVSRVLTAPPPGLSHTFAHPSLAEVERYLKVLNLGNSKGLLNYGTYVNENCGLHVHVGLSPDAPGAKLPIGLIQHLAFMIIQFEPIVSSLHPIGRRGHYGFDVSTMISSNLMGIRRSRHVCNKIPLPELTKIEQMIFQPDMTIKRLAGLLSSSFRDDVAILNYFPNGKFKFVNFSNLIQMDSSSRIPPTIEFRQHEGTLDFEDVSNWIMFVLKFVRAAERKIRQSKPASPATPEEQRSPTRMAREMDKHLSLPSPRRQGNKYKVKCKTQYEEMNRLFTLMELNEDEIAYWLRRYAKLNPEEVIERSSSELIDPVDELQCPICTMERKRSAALARYETKTEGE